MSASRPSQFYELADCYDALNDWKDYSGESARLESIARSLGLSGRASWLDVACGTGRHLEFLRRRHPVVGVDISPKMLRIARHRLPGVRLVRADMRTFNLKARFDVVTCLFGAIAHLRTPEDVREAFSNLARHMNPGGIAIVEPWLEPTIFHPGFIQLRHHQDAEIMVARCAYSSLRRGRAIVQYHFLVGRPGHGVRYLKETDVKLLVSREDLLKLMRKSGLRARFLRHGLTPGMGLLIGSKDRM